MKVCAVIPAFNESKAIYDIIRHVKAKEIYPIVVDDGSEDNTADIAKQADAYVIKHKERSGKGVALKSGFDHAVSSGYDLIFAMDADGQHEPSDMPKFLTKMKESNASVIVGNRMSNPTGMPLIRILTNRFMSFIISALCKQDIPDSQCGFRLYTREAIDSITIKTPKFEIESEVLVKLARGGFKIRSVPVRSIYGQEKSKIRPIRDTLRFFGFLFKTLFSKNKTSGND